MNTKVLVTILLCLLMVGIATANGGVVYDSNVTLENKNSTTWEVLNDGVSATVQYNSSGDEFTWRAFGTVPNHAGEVAECYALIYYADRDNRFVNWDGSNPGARIGTFQVDACSGEFDSGDRTKDLGINLPEYPDFNGNPDPWNEYCGINDTYEHCCGAKLWIVPCSDYETPAMITWNPDDYLFETDLIWYDDTDARNKEPRIEDVDMDDCYQAGDEITITVTVLDEDGIDDLNAMIVTGNFSKYGVEDLVEFTMVDCENGNCGYTNTCIYRDYVGTVVITEANVHECENGCTDMGIEPRIQFYDPEFSYLITATDPADDSGYKHGIVDIEPGPCTSMKFHNLGDYDGEEDLKTVALTQLAYCNVKDREKWWEDPCKSRFGIYMITYTVHVYDEYDNHIGCMQSDNDCCNGFTVTKSNTDVSLKYSRSGGSRLTMVNMNNPGLVTVTAYCTDNDIPPVTQEAEFLMPVNSLAVTASVDTLCEIDECSPEEQIFNVSAQIVDYLNNPILMPGVKVILYVDGVERDHRQTDINGVASFFDIGVEYPVYEVVIRTEAECHQGSLTIPVVEQVFTSVELDSGCISECGDEGEIRYSCYNQNDDEMCCPNCSIVWSCDDLGEIDEDGIFTALDSGICTVTADVCDVVGTCEIVIDCPKNCTVEPPIGEAFVVTSGSVSIAGNFTECGGHACVAALGDPMEGDDDIRGAIVDASENVTLDLAGDGDTWIQNETTGNWSLYATGPISVSMDRHVFALVAIPEPEPEPDPDPTPYTGSSGGSGTYPAPTATPTNNTTVNTTEPEPEAEPTPEPTEKLPARPGSVTVVTDDGEEITITVDEDGNWLPGFNGIFAILGLLSIAYIVNRRRD